MLLSAKVRSREHHNFHALSHALGVCLLEAIDWQKVRADLVTASSRAMKAACVQALHSLGSCQLSGSWHLVSPSPFECSLCRAISLEISGDGVVQGFFLSRTARSRWRSGESAQLPGKWHTRICDEFLRYCRPANGRLARPLLDV